MGVFSESYNGVRTQGKLHFMYEIFLFVSHLESQKMVHFRDMLVLGKYNEISGKQVIIYF
jgi:hypothetical protein